MSDNERNYHQELINLMDMLSEPILTMSDEEIRQEIIEDGEDPDEVAARVKQIISDVVARHKEQGNER